MCAATERGTIPEGLSSLNSSLLFRASCFLYHSSPNSNRVDDFLQLVRDYNDEVPRHVSKDALRLILTTAQHPTASVAEVCSKIHSSPKGVIDMFHWMQKSVMIKSVMQSHYYPGYLFVRYAHSFLENLCKNPELLEKVVKGKHVAPDRLEIHATNATCNYRCQMCLWHVKEQALYDTVADRKILDVNDWNEVLSQAKEMGTKTIIFSGGGEPLMRSNISEIINYAKGLNLFTMIYTNGSRLDNLPSDNPLYKAILHSDWLRVSLHATTNERYSKLVKVPENSEPLPVVLRGLERLRKDKDDLELPLQLGIGFVIQAANYDQVEEMATIANDLKLDFLNFRVDCIDITERLKSNEKTRLYNSLRRVREKLDQGQFIKLKIDFADELIGPMNGWRELPPVGLSGECRVHLYRPAINPFGRMAVCDLTAEPWYSRDELTLGYINENNGYEDVIRKSAKKKFSTSNCAKCMPGQKAINALWEKVLKDDALGIGPEDQPLLFCN
ncbi:MAG: radical SAM protein [bacterium]|nr:radical SAM protein [bacterium]